MTTNVLIDPTVPEADRKLVEKIFNDVEAQIGFVPAGLRLYGISPPLLKAFVGTVGYFMAHERLSPRLLALIRYLVSSKAECRFCIEFNAAILMNQGISAEQLQATRAKPDQAPLGEAEKILLKIALAAIDAPESVSEEDIQAAKVQGCSDRDIFDVVAIAASNKAFTHVLRTFKVEDQSVFG